MESMDSMSKANLHIRVCKGSNQSIDVTTARTIWIKKPPRIKKLSTNDIKERSVIELLKGASSNYSGLGLEKHQTHTRAETNRGLQ